MKFKVSSHTFQIYIVTFPLKNSGQKLVLKVGGYLNTLSPCSLINHLEGSDQWRSPGFRTRPDTF